MNEQLRRVAAMLGVKPRSNGAYEWLDIIEAHTRMMRRERVANLVLIGVLLTTMAVNLATAEGWIG